MLIVTVIGFFLCYGPSIILSLVNHFREPFIPSNGGKKQLTEAQLELSDLYGNYTVQSQSNCNAVSFNILICHFCVFLSVLNLICINFSIWFFIQFKHESVYFDRTSEDTAPFFQRNFLIFREIGYLLVLFHSTLNPILYFTFWRDFKSVAWQILVAVFAKLKCKH